MKNFEFSLTDKVMEKINRFTRKPLEKDRVYAFPVILCDNEIDRDNERFSVSSLEKLASLFIGKTGIFDHDPKGSNQTARVFDTFIYTDKNEKTSYGEPYTCLVARAYMVKTNKNAPLIEEIDAGIKKEVSISCSVAKKVCSVCGRDIYKEPCSHVKGKSYGDKKCFVSLEEPLDAYEWSFVAVPAQVSAGVSKTFGGEEKGRQLPEHEYIRRLEDENYQMRKALEARAQALCQLLGDEGRGAVSDLGGLSAPELIAKIAALALKATRKGTPQIKAKKDTNKNYRL